MIETNWLQGTSLAGLFAFTLLLVGASIACGTWLGTRWHRRESDSGSLGTMVGATLGLLAFMLGFTFNMAANRFDLRKQMYVDEISSIGTTYLRASFLPQPYADDLRRLLVEYVDVRVDAAMNPDHLARGIADSELLHRKLWARVNDFNAVQTPTVLQSLFVQSLNEMIDLHGKRVIVSLQLRIPTTIWVGLFAVTLLAMVLVGYQTAAAQQRNLLVNIVLAIAFSGVISLIADLDRATEGTVKLVQQPLLDLQKQLHAEVVPVE